jgi:hypothetical protein
MLDEKTDLDDHSPADADAAIDSHAPMAEKAWLKNPNTWLSSEDIENVMRQYERKYTCFAFLGPSPVDYCTKDRGRNGAAVCNNLCNFQLENFEKAGKTKIGVIFNLDKSHQPGSHWVSMFINFNRRTLHGLFLVFLVFLIYVCCARHRCGRCEYHNAPGDPAIPR